MGAKTNFIETVNTVIQNGVKQGVLHLNADLVNPEEMTFEMNGKRLVNFGSCSYLGIEKIPAVKQSSIEAIQTYGTQFSSSRAYVSVGLYNKLESKLEKIFHRKPVISQTTSLGHIATLPVLVGENDVVILDHQVHNSVQTAAQLLKAKNIPVEMIRHNRMDLLEERILELRTRYEKIWYLADGIYSMYGDAAPLTELRRLLHQYREFYLYIDDAHGMSCFGRHGQGFVMSELGNEKKVVIAVSLNKSFASGGAAILFPDTKTASLVRTCGGPLITSGPLQPAQLGTALAVADIHLSPAIDKLQDKLHENIKYANLLLEKNALPLVHNSATPIFYIAAGTPKFAYQVLNKMMEAGFYLNLGAFPAVPMKNSGIRFTVTATHSFAQIQQMIMALHTAYYSTLQNEEVTLEQICKAFKMPVPESGGVAKENGNKKQLTTIHAHSIVQLDEQEWNKVMADKGIFDFNGVRMLEEVFSNHSDKCNNWKFDYLLVKDQKDEIVLATFFTTAWMKDDMLAKEEVSVAAEEIRRLQDNPFYRANKIVMTGSLFSEGEHVYLNHRHPELNKALEIFYQTAEQIMEKNEAAGIIIRDIMAKNEKLERNMMDNGFFSLPMPVSYEINFSGFQSFSDFWQSQSANTRKKNRKEVARYSDAYDFRICRQVTEERLEEYHQLYLQVKEGSLELNTYELPVGLFMAMNQNDQWEFMELIDKQTQQLSGVICAYKTQNVYHPMLVGINKRRVFQGSPYRQLLFRMSQYAFEAGYSLVKMGFSADTEKNKIGASPKEVFAYMQLKDNFVMESLQYQVMEKQ